MQLTLLGDLAFPAAPVDTEGTASAVSTNGAFEEVFSRLSAAAISQQPVPSVTVEADAESSEAADTALAVQVIKTGQTLVPGAKARTDIIAWTGAHTLHEAQSVDASPDLASDESVEMAGEVFPVAIPHITRPQAIQLDLPTADQKIPESSVDVGPDEPETSSDVAEGPPSAVLIASPETFAVPAQAAFAPVPVTTAPQPAIPFATPPGTESPIEMQRLQTVATSQAHDTNFSAADIAQSSVVQGAEAPAEAPESAAATLDAPEDLPGAPDRRDTVRPALSDVPQGRPMPEPVQPEPEARIKAHDAANGAERTEGAASTVKADPRARTEQATAAPLAAMSRPEPQTADPERPDAAIADHSAPDKPQKTGSTAAAQSVPPSDPGIRHQVNTTGADVPAGGNRLEVQIDAPGSREAPDGDGASNRDASRSKEPPSAVQQTSAPVANGMTNFAAGPDQIQVEGTVQTDAGPVQTLPPLEMRGTASTPTAQMTPQPADHGARAAGQIAVAVQTAPDCKIEIRLDPAELGHVRVALEPQDGAMVVHLSAERSETMDLLRRHSDQLARELRDLGYRDVSFDFGSDQRQDNRQPARTAYDSNQITATEGDPRGAGAENDLASPSRMKSSSGSGLDLRL